MYIKCQVLFQKALLSVSPLNRSHRIATDSSSQHESLVNLEKIGLLQTQLTSMTVSVSPPTAHIKCSRCIFCLFS